MASIIFDLDGTLADSKLCILKSIRFALSEIGMGNFQFDEIAATQQDLETSFRKISLENEISFEPELCRQFIDLYRTHQLESAEFEICLFPEVKETLECLAKDFRLAVATTKHTAQADRILSRLGIAPLFAHIQGTDSGLRYKPHPDILFKCLETMGLKSHQAAYVGDSVHDMQAARNAGLREIGAGYGFGGSLALSEYGPHWLLSSFAELLPLREDLRSTFFQESTIA